jgi:hypothetical protein
MTFQAGGAERVRIDTSGNVSMTTTGAPAASHLFRYNENGGEIVLNDNTGANGTLLDLSSGSTRLIHLLSTGNQQIGVGAGNTTGAVQFMRAGFQEAMRITSSGNLLVGRTTDFISAKAVVESTNTTQIVAIHNNSTGNSFFSNGVAAASTSWVHFNGVSGNNTVQNIFIYGNGNIQNANNSYGSLSDIKWKENIADATPKLDKLCQVRVVNYNLKGGYEQHKQIGVIAQELEQIFPGMVEESPDRDKEGNDLGTTTKSVKYSVFVPMLIKAIQEQQAIIEQLKADVAALKGATE